MKGINSTMTKWLLVLLLFCPSCITITGLTDGYDKLSEANRQRVVRLGEFTQRTSSEANIVLVSAAEVDSLLQSSDKEYQLCYLYVPHCPSEACIPVSSFVTLCKKYDMEPVVITRYLDNVLFEQTFSIPIYAMDHTKYGTNVVFKYAPRFMSDLTKTEIKDDDPGNLFLFRHGSYVARTDVNHLTELLSKATPQE